MLHYIYRKKVLEAALIVSGKEERLFSLRAERRSRERAQAKYIKISMGLDVSTPNFMRVCMEKKELRYD